MDFDSWFDSESGPVPGCFLCSPEPEWTWDHSENFLAVLGLGPICPGYTLIAARSHVPSMFDLGREEASELEAFTSRVRQRLEALWGASVIGEHGRIAPCVAPAARRHEPHCLHAHRLVFPGHARIDLQGAVPAGMHVGRYESFDEARVSCEGQYIYAEQADGSCEVGVVHDALPRQFLRALVASERGVPQLADWRSHLGREEIERARIALTGTHVL